jgi:predicted dehydrogenase
MAELHRAVIIGAGRIGAGWNWMATPFVYTHADAYRAMGHRVELAAFVETDEARAKAAEAKYGVHVYSKIEEAIGVEEADIVSVCVQPKDQLEVMGKIPASVKGIWCEKPWMGFETTKPVQVNYIRRFERVHIKMKSLMESGKIGKPLTLVVQAKADESTACHFADLARFWGIPVEMVQYVGTGGMEYVTTTYAVMCERGLISFSEGGAHYAVYGMKDSKVFPGIKVAGGLLASGDWTPAFMEAALKNLLDVVDDESGSEKLLLSPPDGWVNSYTERIMRRLSNG